MAIKPFFFSISGKLPVPTKIRKEKTTTTKKNTGFCGTSVFMEPTYGDFPEEFFLP